MWTLTHTIIDPGVCWIQSFSDVIQLKCPLKSCVWTTCLVTVGSVSRKFKTLIAPSINLITMQLCMYMVMSYFGKTTSPVKNGYGKSETTA